ncbi:MAG: hypothetical protein AAGJ18_00695 [Bacteroidota bacterium]
MKKNIFLLLFLVLSLTAFSQADLEEVSVTNLRVINTIHNDFVAVPYGEGIMYNSYARDNNCDTCSIQSLKFASKQADGGNCSFSAGVTVPNQLDAKHNYGAATFAPDGKMMILSLNNNKPRKGDRRKTMKLMSAVKSDQNAWVKGKDLPFNDINYEVTHPFLSPDGQTLYFASDRPGGVGGMDIWKVLKTGDTWGIPTNMGAPINSAGNELFPSIMADGSMYFSSNRAGGNGGLDIYRATMDGGTWTTANLGTPFNSMADDLGYVENADGESGFLTSDRAGGQGLDDIYCWTVNKAPVMLAVEDAINNKRLSGANIEVLGPVGGALAYISDADGSAQPDITYRRTYKVKAEKEGYLPYEGEMTAKELAMADPYILPLQPRAFDLTGDVKIMDTETVVPGSRIVLHNITTGEKREVMSLEDGTFRFDNIYCFEEYELIAYKDNRESAKFPLPPSAIDCSGEKATVVPLRIPPPPPPAVPECDYANAGMLSLPSDQTPKQIHTLGSRPQFGNSHGSDAAGFYKKLQNRYDRSARDKKFLDDLFTTMGYPNGFADATESTFYETTIPNGMTGNMGYTKAHRIQYVELNAKNDRDLEAFRVSSVNGCDVYFMKTCGNLFFFRQ